MTNEELLAALKTEIGWLRNELIRMRDAMTNMESDIEKIRHKIEGP